MARPNPHEEAARLRKVLALVAVIDQLDEARRTPEALGAWTASSWILAARAAGVRPLSLTTISAVIEHYRARATTPNLEADPFARCG